MDKVPYQRHAAVSSGNGEYEVIVPVYQDTDDKFSSLQARVSNRVTDCEMVDDLS
jgi:hypothetical protein